MRPPRSIALLLAAAAGLAACMGDAGDPPAAGRTPVPTPSTTSARVIGLVATLSGPDAWRGEDAFEGADAAVGLLNRGRSGRRAAFELVELDDEGDPRRAVRLVERLAASEQTVGIVYAGPPGALPRAERALARAGIPALSCYGDLYSARALTPHVFQMAPPLLWQARRVAAYLARDRRYARVAALGSATFDGRAAVAAVQTAFRDVRAARLLDRSVVYEPGRIRTALAPLRRRRVEALVVHGEPGDFARVLAALRAMGARYRSTPAARTASRARPRPSRRERRPWRPQVVGFDLAIAPGVEAPAGTVAAETYARGAHYLPVPSFTRFVGTFSDWWGGAGPVGWEVRAFDAVAAIGRAARSGRPAADLARVLERLGPRRFGGLDVGFGPDDHTAVVPTTVGLWTVPAASDRIAERADLPASLRWVPLARGFSIDGRRTTVLPADWKHLFWDAPPVRAPAPRFSRMRYGVTSGRSDPLR